VTCWKWQLPSQNTPLPLLHYENTSFGRSKDFLDPLNTRLTYPDLAKGDPHKHDHVNFSWLKVNTTSSPFITCLNVHASQFSGIMKDESFVLTFQGLKVQEHVCGMVSKEFRGAHERPILSVFQFKKTLKKHFGNNSTMVWIDLHHHFWSTSYHKAM
jgi:hypothetical protein